MILDYEIDMARIFREVWTELRTRHPWPRHITTRWTTAPRGRTLALPLPRSWLGVGGPTPTPPNLHTTHTH
jgi:hypothetical protein